MTTDEVKLTFGVVALIVIVIARALGLLAEAIEYRGGKRQ